MKHAPENHSFIWMCAAQVHSAPAVLARRLQENIVVLFVKLMGHRFLNVKINGAFEC